ncbi:UNVERIFIED_CONTAM: hypothetical protein FKN15_072466 [Acipenser sinensis]
MGEPRGLLADQSPLIKAAWQGKLRLVRLLVEGGAQVNERNEKGETALMVACRARQGEQPGGSSREKLVKYLLEQGADPQVQDKAGRTALMHGCLEKAGPEVAALLLGAGANPGLEDYSRASALVHALNARDKDTLRRLLDACRDSGRDVLIISKDLSPSGRLVTRQYLNVPPSPVPERSASPVSCMSPSDIELKTGSPGSETEGIRALAGHPQPAGAPQLLRGELEAEGSGAAAAAAAGPGPLAPRHARAAEGFSQQDPQHGLG